MAASVPNSLNLRPEPPAGLCHGVPVKGPHHSLHLLDQVPDFFVRLCIGLYLRDALHYMVQKVVIGQAGRQDLLLSHLPQVLLEQAFVSYSCC
jgi:hypothetical protein